MTGTAAPSTGSEPSSCELHLRTSASCSEGTKHACGRCACAAEQGSVPCAESGCISISHTAWRVARDVSCCRLRAPFGREGRLGREGAAGAGHGVLEAPEPRRAVLRRKRKARAEKAFLPQARMLAQASQGSEGPGCLENQGPLKLMLRRRCGEICSGVNFSRSTNAGARARAMASAQHAPTRLVEHACMNVLGSIPSESRIILRAYARAHI
eukprot:6211081-Pleurochrysis_carterae.AAC.11